MDDDIHLEVSKEEFVLIMSALDWYAEESEIRSMYTDFERSSKHQQPARKIYDQLNDENFRRIYDDYITKYYFPSL